MPEDQQEILEFLKQNRSDGPADVDRVIETHGAVVFLHTGEALKIKRAIRYDYLDFSTLELRKAMLERELELNKDAAPELYRDVVAITREGDGSLAFDGFGPVVEWVLRMDRFPDDAELSVMADLGVIDARVAEALGRSLAGYHRKAPKSELGGAELIGDIVDELDRVLGGMTAELGGDCISRFIASAREVLNRQSRLLDDRTRLGWVRRCHGDLHLHNIIMWNGQPTPFDALEFDERLGTCDILYDLAFLLMDLDHRRLPAIANRVLNSYLYHGKEDEHLEGLAALPLYLAIRAAIRAMVDIQTADFQSNRPALIGDAHIFMDQAIAYLDPPRPVLVAIGGLSGTGKTTLAHRIAPILGAFPGAIHLRSDLERKAQFDVEPNIKLPPEAYHRDVTDLVYVALREKARRALGAGHAVILDAVHGDVSERTLAQTIAEDLGCAFCGIWLDAGIETRVQRVDRRALDASDADVTVARQQELTSVGPITWHRVESDGELETLAANVLQRIMADSEAMRTSNPEELPPD